MFEKLLKNRRGSIALVTMLVTLVIVIIIGLVVTAQLNTTALSFNLGASGNATRTTLFTNTWSAYNLAAVIPIVAAAGAIIGVVFFYFRGTR